jgi:hypothetical protein
VLFLRETHEVAGAREREFETLFRDAWMPALARTSGARLLFYLRHVHGTGPSYRVVTFTALRDGAAWQELATRVDGGDLHTLAQELDALRHDVHAKLLLPLPWSPLREIDLAGVPSAPAPHPLTLFMEDTVRPHEGRLEDYVEASGSHYAQEMREHDARGQALLRIEASFRPAFGSHRRREIVLWQRVLEPRGLLPLLTREVPDAYLQPGKWMHDALALRDRWRSRLLRTVDWSPLS